MHVTQRSFEQPKSDKIKTKTQLIYELSELRARVAELEARQANQSQIENALRDSEDTFRNFIDQSPDGIFSLDDQGVVIEWNQAQAQFTGVKREDAVGRFLGELSLNYGRRDDGTRRVIQSKTFPLRIGNKLAIGAINRDITQIKHTEDALRERARLLEERNQELDAFAHTVAHDLKNPLSVIIAYAAMVEDDYAAMTDEERLHDVQAIGRASQKMLRIIDELLLLAGLREAKVTFEPLDMALIVATAQHRLSLIIETSQAEIVVPETWLDSIGYGPWVEEVWANYISNAIKYGGRSPKIELGSSLCPSSDGVRFWIRDYGRGLTEPEQSQLFTPFTRLDQSRAQGHGLGLSIVRRIVEKLNGQVGVESTIGQGSMFYFTLPNPQMNLNGAEQTDDF